MDTTGKLLDILFRRIPPERILDRLQNRRFNIGIKKAHDLEVFLRYAEPSLWGFSGDEQAQLFQHLRKITEDLSSKTKTQPSVFYPLVHFGQSVLSIRGDEPVCLFQEVLRWWEVYHLLGQDMIVCAYLAYSDVFTAIQREKFAWPSVIRTDHGRLNHMLREGLAENHCHLNGSTQSFQLSWYKLMNYPEESSGWLSGFPELLQAVTGRGPIDNIIKLDHKVWLAALARAILFKSLHRGDFYGTVGSSYLQSNHCYSTAPFESSEQTAGADVSADFCSADEFHQVFRSKLDSESYTAEIISVLRQCYGMPVPIPYGSAYCMDYALERRVFLPVANSPYRVLAGERSFLYNCFRACFSGKFTEFEQMLFFFYLLVKTSFRGEMIQVNKQVGFENFSNYEKRKDLIWEDDPYWWEAFRIALNGPICEESVVSLESRFCPKKTVADLESKVARYDFAKWYADAPYGTSNNDHIKAFSDAKKSGRLAHEPHFYVLHYPKRKDDDYSKIPTFVSQCRFETLRQDVKEWTIATAEALSNSPYLCGRIRGIDGCANEVNCRPEVFATAFRYLTAAQAIEETSGGTLLSAPTSRISATYHAGEDFYDIADGLRAIDEAVEFLELKRGDRIGHALALGVDPDIHYQTKSRSIIIPKQNYLDNLVWLLFRGRELNIRVDPQQYGIMQQQANQLLREIYGTAIRNESWSVTLQDYYSSMKLRGDAPELYQSVRFDPPKFTGSKYDDYRISRLHTEWDALRNDSEIAGLYYYYQYGHEERIKGAEVLSIPVTSEYIKVVRQTQNSLQVYLEKKGIIIECNPSSNVLIGTFGDYGHHPIFRFNNFGLDKHDDAPNPQMQVCINTDDLGVFDTSLPFEYALVYRALLEQMDENGDKRYTSTEVVHYLDEVRKMGINAVFPKP